MEDVLYDVWLNELKGVGPHLIKNLIGEFGSALNVYHALPSELIRVDKVGKKLSEFIFTHKDLEPAKKLVDYCIEQTIHIVTPTTSTYPQRLVECVGSPHLLYVKGNLFPLNSLPTSAIVGARRCSEWGKKAASELAASLVPHTCVISGLAKGIDSYAHTEAIRHNGYTVAVVGTGLDRCYPTEHLGLMQKIVETGAVISQFAPFSTIYEPNFLRRNELIAMLSDSIYIMEASKKSGSLYTAECGFKYAKPIYALPGNIYDPLYGGSNELIKKGASIYVGVPKETTLATPSTTKGLDSLSKQILELLIQKPLSLDELHLQSKLDLNLLNEIIFELEMSDHIVQLGGLLKASIHAITQVNA